MSVNGTYTDAGSVAGSNAAGSMTQRWQNVFDRLYDPATYTGVYAERFRSGPGINNDADVKLHHHVSSFIGNTNTGTDEHIRDIKYITRPNLNRDRMDPTSPTGRAAMKARARYDAAERALLQTLSPQATLSSSSMPSVYVLPADSSSVMNGGGASSPGMMMRHQSLNSPGSASVAATETGQPPRELDTNVMLQLLFQYYCRFGRTAGMNDEGTDTLDSFNFAKFTRECPGLLEGNRLSGNASSMTSGTLLNPTEVDLIFVKCKTKNARRLTYSQWLDAQSAMATVKYPTVDDPAAAFSLFLTSHVFTNAAAIGIAQAIRTGLISVEAVPGSGNRGRPRSRSSSRSGLGVSPSYNGQRSVSPGGHSMFASPSRSYEAAGPFSAAAAAAGMSPAAVRGFRLAPEVTGLAPDLHSAPAPHSSGGVPMSPAGASVSAGTPASTPAHPSAPVNVPAEYASIPGFYEALQAAQAALAKAQQQQEPAAQQQQQQQQQQSTDASSVMSRSVSGSGGVTPAAASLASSYPPPPADVYEVIARKALEIQMAQMNIAANNGNNNASFSQQPGRVMQLDPTAAALAAAAIAGSIASQGPASPARANRPWSPARAAAVRSPPMAAASSPSSTAGISATAYPSFRAVTSQGSFYMSPSRQAPSPRSRSPSAASLGISVAGYGGGSGASVSPRQRALSVGGSSYNLGSPDFRPSIAGEANAPGSVFERLAAPEHFTGVYKRAWMSDGRMNHYADTGVSNVPSAYRGNTNTGTNEIIHDIRYTLRPNLNQGKTFK